jgi:hypothetical protein
MDTIRLSNGVILRYRLVPPYARAQAFMNLQDPPPPKIQIESAAGHVEEVMADEDSPEFENWLREVEEVRRERMEAMQSITLDYGIVAWLLPPPPGILGVIVKVLRTLGIQNWRSNPPKGWKIPESLSRYGVDEYINRRLTYIQIELITTNDDLNRVMREVGLGRKREITSEEVAAAEASFRKDMGRGAASGSSISADQGEEPDAGGDLSRQRVGA